MEWGCENPDDHWRDRIHTLEYRGTLYALEYVDRGDPKVGWWLFLDDEEEGEPISLILWKSKEIIEGRLTG